MFLKWAFGAIVMQVLKIWMVHGSIFFTILFWGSRVLLVLYRVCICGW